MTLTCVERNSDSTFTWATEDQKEENERLRLLLVFFALTAKMYGYVFKDRKGTVMLGNNSVHDIISAGKERYHGGFSWRE